MLVFGVHPLWIVATLAIANPNQVECCQGPRSLVLMAYGPVEVALFQAPM